MRSHSRVHPRPITPNPRPHPHLAEVPAGSADAISAPNVDVAPDLRAADVLTRTVANAPAAVIGRADGLVGHNEGEQGFAADVKEIADEVRDEVASNPTAQKLAADAKEFVEELGESPAADAARKVASDARGTFAEARDAVAARLADVKAYVAAKLPEAAEGDGVIAKLAAELKARVAGDHGDAARAHLLSLVKQFNVAMFVTHDTSGGIHARPMAVADLDADGNLWFVTDRASTKVHEIESHRDVSVIFQSESAAVTISGRAALTTDKKRVRELWTEAWRVWFPDGPDEHDLVLVCVETTRGEYWDQHTGSRLRYLVDAARAYVKGEKLDEPSSPTHGTASLA